MAERGGRRALAGLPVTVAPWVALVFVCASAGYLSWWGVEPTVGGDTSGYQLVARSFGDGWASTLHERTPGYPLVLWLTASTSSLTPTLTVVQLACHLAAAWLTLVLLQRFAVPHVLTISVAVGLVSPPLTEKAFQGLTEAVTELLLVLAVAAFVVWRERGPVAWAVGSGVALGAAALVRPTFQAAGLLLAGWVACWLWRREGRRRAVLGAAALVAGSVVLVGGLATFNLVRFDHAGTTPLLGWNLSTRTALFVEELPAGEPARPVLVAARNESLVTGESHSAVMYVWPARPEVEEAVGLHGAALDRYMLRLNLRLIAANPFDYLLAVGGAAAGYVLPAATDKATGGTDLGQAVFGIAHLAVLTVFVVQAFGFVGLYVARRLGAAIPGAFRTAHARRVWLVASALVVYTAVVSTTVEMGNPRYRTPTDPLILLVTAGGLWTVWSALRVRAVRGGRS